MGGAVEHALRCKDLSQMHKISSLNRIVRITLAIAVMFSAVHGNRAAFGGLMITTSVSEVNGTGITVVNGQNVTVASGATGTITMDVFANVTGNNGVLTDDGLTSLRGLFSSRNVNGGVVFGNLTATNFGAFTASGSTGGNNTMDFDGDGDLDIMGTSTGTLSSGWFIGSAGSNAVAMSASGQGVKVATLTYTLTSGVANVQAGASTIVDFWPISTAANAYQPTGAGNTALPSTTSIVWRVDGVNVAGNITGGTAKNVSHINSGDQTFGTLGVTITMAGGVVEPTNNNTQIVLTGGTAGAAGSSTHTVSMADVFVGAAAPTVNVGLSKTGSETTNYAITANSSGLNSSVAVGQSTAVGANAQSPSITYTLASTSTSGAYSHTSTIDNLATTSSGAGLGSADGNDVVTITGNVLEHAQLVAPSTSPVAAGGNLVLTNAAGSTGTAVRGKAVVKAVTTTLGFEGGWTVGADVARSNGATSGTGSRVISASAAPNLMNGVHRGRQTVSYGDENLAGASTANAGVIGTVSFELERTVTGNSGNQVAQVLAGNSFAGLSATGPELRFGGRRTTVQFLGGTASADRTISAAGWRVRNDDVESTFLSDVVNVTGFGGTGPGSQTDTFVMQMEYDLGLLAPNASHEGLRAEKLIHIGWKDTTGAWVNAVNGNHGAAFDSVSGYVGERAYNAATDFALGKWGVYTDTAGTSDTSDDRYYAWAVLNHNSEFVVVPEPGSLLLMAMGGLLLVWRVRKRKTA